MSIPKNDQGEIIVNDEKATSQDTIVGEGFDVLDDKSVPVGEDEFANPEGEPVQVAMNSTVIRQGTKVVTDAVKDYFTGDNKYSADAVKSPKQKIGTSEDPAVKKTQEDITNKGDAPIAIVSDEGNIWVRQATAEELNTIKDFVIGDDGLVDKDFDLALPNIDNVNAGASGDTADVMLKKIIAATYKTYKDTKYAGTMDKVLRKGERGFQDIINDANKIGAVDAIIMLLTRQPGERPFTDSELLAARRTLVSFELVTAKALKKAEKTGSDADLAKVFQLMHINAYAQIQLVGVGEDIARTQVSQKIIAPAGKSRIQSLRTWADTNMVGDFTTVLDDANIGNFIEANGGMDTIRTAVVAYKRLPTDESRNKFIKMTLMERAKLVPRMVVEIYQSALLSSGVTHAFNTAGQAAFMELLMVEKFASGEMKEGMAMLAAHGKYFGQSLRAMAHAFIHEKSMTENVSKLDIDGKMVSRHSFGLRYRGAGTPGEAIESAGALFMDGFGISMRALGYRPMLAIDEFFKTMSRGMQLEVLATRAKGDAYTSAIQSGKSADEAKTIANTAYIKTRDSQAAFDEASEFARMVTFQDDLPDSFQKLNFIMNNPIMKIWIPFYKTPTQIVRRVLERSPLGVITNKEVRDNIAAGGRRRKEALVKMTYGTGIFGTLATLGSGGYDEGMIMTGYGPSDYGLRKAWLEDHQPYSFGFKKEDGTWDWVSYARYDPLSGVLAMAADFADIAYQSEDTDLLSDQMIAGGLATMKYVGTNLPMTQFIGEVIDLAGGVGSGEVKAKRFRELLAKQVFQAGGIVKEHVMSGGMNGIQLKGSLERSGLADGPVDANGNPLLTADGQPVGSEMGSMTMADEQYGFIPEFGFQPEIRAYYQSLNILCSKTPGCSSKLPPKVNRWNEMVPQTRGTGWEFVQPWRVINKPEAKRLNKEFLSLGLALQPLKDTMGEPLIRLNNEQMKRYIELYNDPMSSPFAETYFKLKVFAGGQFTAPPPALAALNKELDNPFYLYQNGDEERNASTGDKIRRLRNIDNEYRSYAKALMLLEFDDLAALTQERDNYKDTFGKQKPYLDKPTAVEKMQATQQIKEEIFGLQ